MDALGATLQQTMVLLDLLAGVVDDPLAIQTAADGSPAAADAHRLTLFLFVQYYIKEAQRTETADTWPPDHPSATQLEPSSPMRLTARSWAKEQVHHRGHLPATRQKMQEHLFFEEALIKGLGAFIAEHAAEVVGLIAAGSPAAPSDTEDIFEASASELDDEPVNNSSLVSTEIDRLGFLLTIKGTAGAAGEGMITGSEPNTNAFADAYNSSIEASPMEVCGSMNDIPPGGQVNGSEPGSSSSSPEENQGIVDHQNLTPITILSELLPEHLWSPDGSIPRRALTEWLKESLGDEKSKQRGGGIGDVTMMGVSPPRVSMFDQLAPPVLSMLSPVDVYGVQKTTALRGESELASTSTVRIMDCHDSIVYCLAPLQHAIVSCCTDCVVVLGAVGKAVRIERCERVQLVVAAQRVVVNTCHDCILYLAVNRAPVLLGDNRFVQLAPHNAGYDRLAHHVMRAGVRVDPRAWCAATPLLPNPNLHVAAIKHHNALLAGGGSYGSSPPPNQNSSIHLGTITSSPTTIPAGLASPSRSGGPLLSPLKMISPTRSLQVSVPNSPLPVPGSPAAAVGAEATPPAPGQPPSTTLLPPEKLVPFSVPFTGGEGPLCGGPARQRTPASSTFGGGSGEPSSYGSGGNNNIGNNGISNASNEDDPLAGLLGGVSGSGAEAFGPSPFPLPPEYAAAWEERMSGMAAVRAAYRQSGLDDVHKREFIGAIQAHFKEWLQAGSAVRMREVYDLARAEKECIQ